MTEFFENMQKFASRMAVERPDAAVVISPADLSDLSAECAKYAAQDPTSLGAVDTFYGIKVFTHGSIPRGDAVTCDTVERARKLLDELDKAHAKGLPWQVAILNSRKTASEEDSNDSR